MSEEDTVLPASWSNAPLGEIATLSLGKMLDRKQNTGLHPTPYLRNINVRWHRVDLGDLQEMDIDPVHLERVSLRSGDVVVCEGGEPGRASVWRGEESMAIQKALHRVRLGDLVDPEYLVFLFEREFRGVVDHDLFTGTTIKHLPKEKIAQVHVPLPPLAEQQRIVEVLEEHLSHLEAALAGIASVRAKAVQFRRSLLRSASTGALVGKTGERMTVAFGDCFETITTGVHKVKRSSYADEGLLPVVDQGDGLVGGYTSDMAQAFEGELPVVLFGDHTRRVKYIDFSFAVGADGVKVLRPVAGFDERLAAYFLEAAELRDRGYSRHFAELRKELFWVPPPELQATLVATIDVGLSHVDAALSAARQVEMRCAALRRSLLHAAFTGRLTAEWRERVRV